METQLARRLSSSNALQRSSRYVNMQHESLGLSTNKALIYPIQYGQEPGARNETKVALDGKGRELYTNLVPCSQSFACVVLLQGEVILDQNPPDLLFYPELPCDGNVASVTPLAPMGFWKRAQIENENEPAV